MTFQKKVQKAKLLIKKYIAKKPIIACSFGKDSIVMLHLINQVKKGLPVFATMADTEFPETYEFAKDVVKNWKLNYKEYRYSNKGAKKSDCCRSKKVEQFKKALKDYNYWFSAIRKDEGITRTNFKEVEVIDGLTKINPILDFTEKDIWRYTAIYGLPVNPMYGKGYRSLSCKKCSTKEMDEKETERAGRWKGTCHEGKECGIHTQTLR